MSASDSLSCPEGCCFPVVQGIPRFVPSEGYAAAFGLQWNTYGRTQLDSYTGTTLSQDRLTRSLGGSLEVVKGQDVLEVGCGAGRFTEVLLVAGARVFACDLSEAVVANQENCGRWPGHFVCQADVLQIPAATESFPIVICLGMIQHTPDPEATIRTLAGYVAPGGLLVIDHYTWKQSLLWKIARWLHPATLLRLVLSRLPARVSLRATDGLARLLLPVHKRLWRRGPVVDRLRHVVNRLSPLADYYDRYPELGSRLLEEWAYLDTHDRLTDRYKRLRSLEQIRSCLSSCGLADIQAAYAGNGVEARGRKPAVP